MPAIVVTYLHKLIPPMAIVSIKEYNYTFFGLRALSVADNTVNVPGMNIDSSAVIEVMRQCVLYEW